MYPLFAPLVWLFIVTICAGAAVIDKCSAYRNTVIRKTASWPFWISSIIVVLMTALTYNTASIWFEGVAHRAIIQTMTASVLSAFLVATIWLSLTGMARRFNAKLVEFVENL